MSKPLFRNQAVEKQKDKLQGDVLLKQPIGFGIVTFSVCMIITLLVIFLITGKFARQEIAVGFLLPDRGIIKVYSPQLGNVEEVLVEEGEEVSQGQALAIIRTSKIMRDGSEASQVQIDHLKKQLDIVNKQVKRLSPIFQDKREVLNLQIQSIRIDKNHLAAQIDTSNRKLVLQNKQLDVARGLAKKKHLTQARVDEVESLTLSLVSELQSLERLSSQRTREAIQLAEQIVDLKISQDEQQDQLLSRRFQLEQMLTEAESNHQFVLRAENAGTISSIQFKAGQRVSSQTPLLSLIPINSKLQAELLIPTKAIGFVKHGQQVSLQYDAFPFQKFGLSFGTVSAISKNVLMPSELSNTPIPINIPSYRVTVELDSQQVSAYGQQFALKPGIQFTANIRLDERSIIEWLLEPIHSLKGRFS